MRRETGLYTPCGALHARSASLSLQLMLKIVRVIGQASKPIAIKKSNQPPLVAVQSGEQGRRAWLASLRKRAMGREAAKVAWLVLDE